MDDVAPRRIRLSSVLTAFAAVLVLSWSGFNLHRSRYLVEEIKLPVSHAYVRLSAVPLGLWYGTALVLGALLCAKDLRVDEERSRLINTVAIPVLFLVYLLVDIVARSPLYALLEGWGGRR